MAITMQGSWTISVKSKSARRPQRFIVAGATSGNGAYLYKSSSDPAPVLVTGDAWSITIQNDPGSGFVTSAEQIKFPTISGGLYQFDIESDDGGGSGGSDQDFNDLVLTCSTPVTTSDFLLFGNVSCYEGWCFNPCYSGYVVIDSYEMLAEALRRPLLRDLVAKLYPDRLKDERPQLGPTPDPPPFRPMVLPLEGDTALPPRKAQILRVANAPAASRSAKSKKAASEESTALVTQAGSIDLGQPAKLAFDYDRVAVASLIDLVFKPYCVTQPMPGMVLRFLEYDRTGAEKAGGPYTGTGGKENLGVAVSDMNGNYIFRFQHSSDSTNEAVSAPDWVQGEDFVVQMQPDVIVQVLDAMAPTGVVYESAPYWNIPLFKRINVCKSGCRRLPTACQGSNAIQAIGNIDIGEPEATPNPFDWEPRVGFSNTLNEEGKITSKNPDAPDAFCAGWAGTLDFYACFLDQEDVTHYTIQYARSRFGPWNYFQEVVRHEKTAKVGIPGYIGDKIGPFDFEIAAGGGTTVKVPAYHNIENDNDFRLHNRDRKARISSWVYAPVADPGAVYFRIQGYDEDGNQVAGASDTIKLFIDNSRPDLDIDSVSMGGQPGGGCALFTVPENDPGAPLTVRFKAIQAQGLMNKYTLSMRKGNIGPQPILNDGPGLIEQTYVHGADDKVCNSLRGTLDDPVVDGFGYVITDIKPDDGNWLDGVPFCTFAVKLGCSTRVTDGYHMHGPYGPILYLLGIEAHQEDE